MECLRGLFDSDANELPNRMWAHDTSVWQRQGREASAIKERLGWLAAPSRVADSIDEYLSFVEEICSAGYTKVVVLGMGGSSLFAEFVRKCWGSREGYLDLLVLDSTMPSAISRLVESLDLKKTLFLVSSKSGTTTEALAFFSLFYDLIYEFLGDEAGQSFVAITDPNTPLVALAKEYGFRRVFYADPFVGGRYSAFTPFGMLPAALAGLDICRLVCHAVETAESCRNISDPAANPGISLGIKLGNSYLNGRDKLTLLCSPSISSFGLWLEQLVAESTGKDGEGMLPIIEEPVCGPGKYGQDRVFVVLRLSGDNNNVIDKQASDLIQEGHEVIEISIGNKYELGSELYRWMFATSTLGAVMRIDPFDQPNVQESKDNTEDILAAFARGEGIPSIGPKESIENILSEIKEGQYLAIMAYVGFSSEVDAALKALREVLCEKYSLTTTIGYGPRFLHSTGQLHKGGRNIGHFLQICEKGADLPIPGRPYGFAMLAEAQSIGDYQALKTRGFQVARIDIEADADTADAISAITSAI